MRKLIFVFLNILIWKFAIAQKEVTVFESGKEGYASFRIPSVIKLPNYKILAFAEGRVNGGADFGNIKIVLKTEYDLAKLYLSIDPYITIEKDIIFNNYFYV